MLTEKGMQVLAAIREAHRTAYVYETQNPTENGIERDFLTTIVEMFEERGIYTKGGNAVLYHQIGLIR